MVKKYGRILLLTVLVILLVIINRINQQLLLLNNKIFPNVYIDQVSVGGYSKNQAEALFQKLYQNRSNFQVELALENDKIATISADNINYRLPIKNVVEQAYLVGRSPNFLSRWYQKLALVTGGEKYFFNLNGEYDRETVKTNLERLNDAYKIKPQEARFEFANNRVSVFQNDKKGQALNVEQAISDLDQKIAEQKSKPQKQIIIAFQKIILEPKIKLANINNLGIKELVATGVSHFQGSSAERSYNIKFGSLRLNGIIIKPGETFSFNQNIGEISTETGFKPAYVIKDGRTVLGDGGGICQVSTTVFRLALNAGLPIVERHAHAYRVGYYEQDMKPGFDATIYSPTDDLKFKNNYASALLLQTAVDEENQVLTYSFFGSKDNRKVTLSDVSMWNAAAAPPPEYQDDYSLPEGVVKQVDFAAPGLSTKFTYQVEKDGEVLTSQEFVSHFKPWKAVFLVGKKTG